MTPLSTFMYCFSGFSFAGPINCTNAFTENIDYIVSGKSCFAVLTSTNWPQVNTIFTPLCSQLSYFAVTSALSSVTSAQSNAYGNQPYLTGGNVQTFSSIVCAYGNGQTVPILTVSNGNEVFIGVDFTWSESNNFRPGFMNLNLNGSTLESLFLYNCYLTGINMSADFNCSNLNTVGFSNTKFWQGQTAPGIGLKSFLERLVSQGPNNGSLYALNDFSPLDPSVTTVINTLTSTKGWFYQRQTN